MGPGSPLTARVARLPRQSGKLGLMTTLISASAGRHRNRAAGQRGRYNSTGGHTRLIDFDLPNQRSLIRNGLVKITEFGTICVSVSFVSTV